MPSPYRPTPLEPADVFLKSEPIDTNLIVRAGAGIGFNNVPGAQLTSVNSGNTVAVVGARTLRSGASTLAGLPGPGTRAPGSIIYVSDINGYMMTTGTAWVDVVPDTGVRDVGTDLLTNNWTCTNQMLLQRIANRVFLTFMGLSGSASTGTNALMIPAGFRPARFTSLVTQSASGAYANSGFYARSPGEVVIPQTAPLLGAGGVYTEISWYTNNPFPTTLPGVAV